MRLRGIRAVTLDFGNTLVPIGRAELREVVDRTARAACRDLDLGTPAAFLAAWSDERERQFREEVPLAREVDLPQRAVRVLARLRGMAAPSPDERWDDDAARGRSTPAEVESIVDAYSDAFVALINAPLESGLLIHRLRARGFLVAILSNWPLATTIDRFAAAAGWTPALAGIFVSQRIGTIKPHPAIFEHARSALDVDAASLLHVGDDWAADIVGALGAGWRAAYLIDHQADTPLPTSARSGHATPDLELHRLADVDDGLADPPREQARPRTP